MLRSTGVNKFSIRHVKLDGFTARSMNSEAPGPQMSNVMYEHGDHVSIALLLTPSSLPPASPTRC